MGNGNDHLVEKLPRTLYNVEVTVCNGIEATRVNRASHTRNSQRNSQMKSELKDNHDGLMLSHSGFRHFQSGVAQHLRNAKLNSCRCRTHRHTKRLPWRARFLRGLSRYLPRRSEFGKGFQPILVLFMGAGTARRRQGNLKMRWPNFSFRSIHRFITKRVTRRKPFSACLPARKSTWW